MASTLFQPTTALYDAQPKVVLDVNLDRVDRLSSEYPTLVGPGDVRHTVYVVNEDGHLVGVFLSQGAVELKEVVG